MTAYSFKKMCSGGVCCRIYRSAKNAPGGFSHRKIMIAGNNRDSIESCNSRCLCKHNWPAGGDLLKDLFFRQHFGVDQFKCFKLGRLDFFDVFGPDVMYWLI